MALMIEVIKGTCFRWTPKAQSSFEEIKAKLIQAPILALPHFNKNFEVECNVSHIGIGGALSQEGKPMAFFTEKLYDSRCKYSTYDKELYAIVRCLEDWNRYLVASEFILHYDHESLKYIQGHI